MLFSWLNIALSGSEDKFQAQINGTVVASATAAMSLTVHINNREEGDLRQEKGGADRTR